MNTSLKLLATGFALSIVFASCKKEEEEVVVSDTPKEIILPRVQPIPAGDYVAPSAKQQAQQQQQVQNNQVMPPPPPPAQVKAGMNPAHGQPGHRCDIQVGAPLNSAPATPPAQTGSATSKQITMPTPTMTPTTNSTPSILNPNATPTAPGMNPPHGEAGHRCEVAVGAPLPK